MSKEMKIEMSIFVLLTASLGVLWYHAWIKPADQMRYEIISCMNETEDSSIDGYKACKESLVKGKK